MALRCWTVQPSNVEPVYRTFPSGKCNEALSCASKNSKSVFEALKTHRNAYYKLGKHGVEANLFWV